MRTSFMSMPALNCISAAESVISLILHQKCDLARVLLVPQCYVLRYGYWFHLLSRPIATLAT